MKRLGSPLGHQLERLLGSGGPRSIRLAAIRCERVSGTLARGFEAVPTHVEVFAQLDGNADVALRPWLPRSSARGPGIEPFEILGRLCEIAGAPGLDHGDQQLIRCGDSS